MITSSLLLSVIVESLLCLIFVGSKRIDPWWPWSWNSLSDMIWASGQGGSTPSGMPTDNVLLYSKYPLMWTQGILSLHGNISGYQTWEQAVISDAEKIHNINKNEPVMGYYGFPGCCYSHYAGYYTKYMTRNDLWLYDDSGNIVYWEGDGEPFTPIFNFCNFNMIDFYKNTIINEFMESNQISGIFFDETEAYIDGPNKPNTQAFIFNNYNFSLINQKKIQNCFKNAMVNITKYMAVKYNKWGIPSSNAYNKQYHYWDIAQTDVIINYGGFKFIELLECYGNGIIKNITNINEWNNIINTNGFKTNEWKELLSNENKISNNNFQLNWACPNFTSQSLCCQDMILTCMNISQLGGALMIRGGQNNDNDYSDRYYQIAAFLLMANEYSYFAGGNGWSGSQSFPWFDIYNYPIGIPKEQTQIFQNQTVFSRQFENVYVSFNLSQGVSALYFYWNISGIN